MHESSPLSFAFAGEASKGQGDSRGSQAQSVSQSVVHCISREWRAREKGTAPKRCAGNHFVFASPRKSRRRRTRENDDLISILWPPATSKSTCLPHSFARCLSSRATSFKSGQTTRVNSLADDIFIHCIIVYLEIVLNINLSPFSSH